jgi:hypothetical protein
MKERPILFSAPMVRALLDGTKTQTRRVVKHKWPHLWTEPWYPTGKVLTDLPNQSGAWMEFRRRQQDVPGYEGSPASTLVPCPHGQPGDRLWVRETHAPQADCWGAWDKWMGGVGGPKPIIHYAADGGDPFIDKWRPSIHMPRWASRITLEVTEVRVERLQDISDADSIAEGVDRTNTSIAGYARQRYADLWNSINGNTPGSWDANPWVWAISFRRLP